MPTITIPKKEYSELLEKKMRYEYLRAAMEDDIFSPPPTRSAKDIIKTLSATKQYSQTFLSALEKGLKRSSHFRV